LCHKTTFSTYYEFSEDFWERGEKMHKNKKTSRSEVNPLNVRLLRPKSHGPTVQDYYARGHPGNGYDVQIAFFARKNLFQQGAYP